MTDFLKRYGWAVALALFLLTAFSIFEDRPESAPVAEASVMPSSARHAADTSAVIESVPPQRVSPVRITGDLDFAGEPVPLSDQDIRERLDREILVNTFWHSNTMFTIKKANKYFPSIEQVLRAEGVPLDFKYLAIAESGLDNVTSPAGAKGFWQFMKPTAQEYGLEVTGEVDERYDYIKSAHAACQYLKDAKDDLGSWTLAAAAYNMGQPRLEKRLEEQGVDSYYDLFLNAETARYLYRILAYKLVFEDPQMFGFHLTPSDLYTPIASREVEVTETIDDLAAFALEQGTNYKMLKTLNPWLTSDRLGVAAGDAYVLRLPQPDEAADAPVEE